MRDFAMAMEATAASRHPAPGTEVAHLADRALRIVLVDEELPYPANSGKRIRTLNLMTRLARKHYITYICHRNADPAEAKQAAEYLGDHGIAAIVVDRVVPPKSGVGFYARLGLNLLSPLPYSVASHTSRQILRAVQQYQARHSVDLWQCEWTPYAAMLRSVTGPRIVHTQNVEAAIWRRYFETESNGPRRWYIKRQWLKFLRFEREALNNAHRTIAVSEQDAQVFRNEYGVRRVDVVENGVDTAYFHPTDNRRDPKRLLFLGSLDWRPNIDAVDQLLDHVFPAVRGADANARLVIVGRNPSAALRVKIATRPSVELHANVADVRPYLASCGLMVVPLRIGGGSRIKILEALASEMPVIATRIGAEGLDLVPGRHLTIVEAVADLVPAILAAFPHGREALAQAKRARRAVVEKYDWDRLACNLERIWCDSLVPAPTGIDADTRISANASGDDP
jgi:polysaccharide biosynthesis protein PslH